MMLMSGIPATVEGTEGRITTGSQCQLTVSMMLILEVGPKDSTSVTSLPELLSRCTQVLIAQLLSMRAHQPRTAL
jgi:hypothetical protein